MFILRMTERTPRGGFALGQVKYVQHGGRTWAENPFAPKGFEKFD